MIFEDIQLYLPQFLSSNSTNELFSELKNFPNNKPIYSYNASLQNELLQGDGLKNLPYLEIPYKGEKSVNGMILSNSCDIDQSNRRLMPLFAVFAPIVNLENYKNLLISKHVSNNERTKEEIDLHISNIKNQKLTNTFYLEPSAKLTEESVVFFDKCISIPPEEIFVDNISNKKIFTLNNFGFYFFLLKLSIHSTRIRDGVDRH